MWILQQSIIHENNLRSDKTANLQSGRNGKNCETSKLEIQLEVRSNRKLVPKIKVRSNSKTPKSKIRTFSKIKSQK